MSLGGMTSLLATDVRLAFLGVVTIYQGERKFAAEATLFAEGDAPADSFFGHYTSAIPDGVESGPALIRFSEGSEAHAVLAAVDADRGGFRLTSGLRDLSRGV
jgi:hypothetical protein